MPTSDALPRAQQSAWQRWELASLAAHDPAEVQVDVEAEARAEEARRAAAAAAAARAEAHAQGYAAGLAEAREENARLDALLGMLAEHAARHEQQLADEILDLALVLARELAGGALEVKRELIVPTVIAALRQLPRSVQRIELRLHPADASLVRERLAEETDMPRATLVADPAVAPGGCHVDSDQASVDATFATRWRRLLAGLGRPDDWLEPR